MENNNKQALIIAYYLSRFDRKAIINLNYKNISDAFRQIGILLGVKENTIKNMRDQFDPYFGENPRKGWVGVLSPSRQAIFEQFKDYTEEDITALVQSLLNGNTDELLQETIDSIPDEEMYMLKNLHELAANSQQRYKSEFKETEISLNEEFQAAFGAYLRENNQNIVFKKTTSTISSSGNKKIYAPNQWFVMATYMSDFTKECFEYKKHALAIIARVATYPNGKKEYIGALQNSIDENKVKTISNEALYYFKELSTDKAEVATCVNYIINFLTNYDWWFGSKTIDRGDFYISPVLNLLEVVHVSQSYIADIAYAMAHDENLLNLSKDMILYSEGESESKNVRAPNELPSIFEKNRKTGGQNLIIYGAPGTGKSRKLEDMFKAESDIKRVVFHAEYTYFDFVGSYKPVPVYKKNDAEFIHVDNSAFITGEPFIDYRFVAGPFIQTLIDAWLHPENMYTLLIEEINRANPAGVFGEIFQLLDRLPNGQSEYCYKPSEDLFQYLSSIDGVSEHLSNGMRIPSNMNIVATMNSADQGVHAIDSAFKRRWNYKYLTIDINNAIHANSLISYAGKQVTWGIFISAVNEKLKDIRINEDKLIGPYFIKPDEVANTGARDKLLLYLWDDVLRHCREKFFAEDIKTFSNLSESFQRADVLMLNLPDNTQPSESDSSQSGAE